MLAVEGARLALVALTVGHLVSQVKWGHCDSTQRCFEGRTDLDQKFRAMVTYRWDHLREDGFNIEKVVLVLTLIKPVGGGPDQDHILVFSYSSDTGFTREEPRVTPVFTFRCMKGCEGFAPVNTWQETQLLADCLRMGRIEQEMLHEHDCPACLNYEGRSCYPIICADDHSNPAPAGTETAERAMDWAIRTGGKEPFFVQWNDCPTCTAESIRSAEIADQVAQEEEGLREEQLESLQDDAERRR